MLCHKLICINQSEPCRRWTWSPCNVNWGWLVYWENLKGGSWLWETEFGRGWEDRATPWWRRLGCHKNSVRWAMPTDALRGRSFVGKAWKGILSHTWSEVVQDWEGCVQQWCACINSAWRWRRMLANCASTHPSETPASLSALGRRRGTLRKPHSSGAHAHLLLRLAQKSRSSPLLRGGPRAWGQTLLVEQVCLRPAAGGQGPEGNAPGFWPL